MHSINILKTVVVCEKVVAMDSADPALNMILICVTIMPFLWAHLILSFLGIKTLAIYFFIEYEGSKRHLHIAYIVFTVGAKVAYLTVAILKMKNPPLSVEKQIIRMWPDLWSWICAPIVTVFISMGAGWRQALSILSC